MKLVKIPKKQKGQFREICVPTPEEKQKFRLFVSELNEKAKKLCDKEIVHGFMHEKSPVTNAKKHVGFKYSLKFDLSDFFDTVKPIHLKGKIPEKDIVELMPDNRAYQGLPTSPIVANIAAVEMDRAISRKIQSIQKEKGENCPIVFTRYADDLCFSFNDFSVSEELKKSIPNIVSKCGFRINKKKTWLQDSRFGNRKITGVCVSDSGISATREVRRKLRAAIHQKNKNQIRGFSEWCALKTPKPYSEKPVSDVTQSKMSELCKFWDVKVIKIKNIPKKETLSFPEDQFIISGDPVQILGLSNWTTNWRSCMAHPKGQYHKGANFWVLNQGTRIAGILSGSTKTEESFTRPTFKARAMVHESTDGKLYFDVIYGESDEAKIQLVQAFKKHGILPIYYNSLVTKVFTECPQSYRSEPFIVKGMVPRSSARNPYFDSLLYKEIKKDGKPFIQVFHR